MHLLALSFLFPGKKPHLSSERGFTLTELALVLGVVGLVIGAIWAVSSDVRLSDQVRMNNNQLLTITQNTKAIFSEQGGVRGQFATLTVALDQARAFPLEMRPNQGTPTGILNHPWSTVTVNGLGTVQVAGDDCSGNSAADDVTTYGCFQIAYYSVPQNACEQMLVLSALPGTGLLGVAVNGGLMINPPVDLGTADTACTSASQNTLVWTIALKNG